MNGASNGDECGVFVLVVDRLLLSHSTGKDTKRKHARDRTRDVL
jgi:hypothetical protein